MPRGDHARVPSPLPAPDRPRWRARRTRSEFSRVRPVVVISRARVRFSMRESIVCLCVSFVSDSHCFFPAGMSCVSPLGAWKDDAPLSMFSDEIIMMSFGFSSDDDASLLTFSSRGNKRKMGFERGLLTATTAALLLCVCSESCHALQLVSSSSASSSLSAQSWSPPSQHRTSFLGSSLRPQEDKVCPDQSKNTLTMRKQKASDRRTRRRQRGEVDDVLSSRGSVVKATTTVTTSPMQVAGDWRRKKAHWGSLSSSSSSSAAASSARATGGGRGRSRKRSTLYQTLAFYHQHFLKLLTAEYQAEEEEVMGRIKASIDDPLGLENAGYALFDLCADRRGNLFTEEVYRLTKAPDATTRFDALIGRDGDDDESQRKARSIRYLPMNHKFSNNDVIVLTKQPDGSGDFFSPNCLPISDQAVTVEGRVLNIGPSYLDIAVTAGTFEAAFGSEEKSLRVRADKFVSNVPYQRMVAALFQVTAIPDSNSKKASLEESGENEDNKKASPHENISMDEVFREAILATHAYTNPHSPYFGDPEICNMEELAHKLARPPMAPAHKLASQVLKYMQSDRSGVFAGREFNAPQRAAVEAALTRRMTLIHGPPGSGKTTVAAAIAFGFVHQCRNLSPAGRYTKVLASAFSNVGADNLAQSIQQLGLKVVRIGKPSAVTESLWDCTLDAAIDRDPDAQRALRNAARATAQLSKHRNSRTTGKAGSAAASVSESVLRAAATSAVKTSIEASNIAATKALREADVIVATCTGAADPRLLAACGLVTSREDRLTGDKITKASQTDSRAPERTNAPDGLPPLSLPFVVLDEACQSVEPASLIPIVSSNSCRSLVMLGDPCQLPPTVLSQDAAPLSLSLMERLAASLPHPHVSSQVDKTIKDATFLDALPVKQAVSLIRARSTDRQTSYRKMYHGSLLLSVQYRMHPSIAALPSAIFYDGLLATPNFMAGLRSFPNILNQNMPCGDPRLGVRLIDVGGRDNERQGMPTRYTQTVFRHSDGAEPSTLLEEQTTYWNEPEAERVIALLKELLDAGSDPDVSSIGIISPYNGQVQMIKSMIASDDELRELLLRVSVSIEVESVDGYQGRERDVIIFSAVRSNRHDRIGFLHDWRRMNVALTRAKSALLVVGDLETLSSADKHWDALYKWATGVRCVVDDFEDLEDELSV